MTTPNITQILLQLPNPFTPMAFLPPELARQVTVAIYAIVGALAVIIWDVLSNLHNDFALLTRYKINLSTIVYFISRLSSLGYILGLTIIETAPIGDCSWVRRIQILYPFTIPSTSLLFFFRVVALFHSNKPVIIFFFLSWLAVLGGSITVTYGVKGMNIGLTQYCINDKSESYVAYAALMPLINDFLVFCATSFALLKNSYEDVTIKTGFRILIFGQYLPAFSRAILKDGQAYYLTTVGLNLAVVLMFYTPEVPVVYSNLLGVPEIALMNIMACLVYRNVRFGIFREAARNSSISGTLGSSGRGNTPSGLVFGPNPKLANAQPIPMGRSPPASGDVERGRIGLQKHKNGQMDVVELDGMRSDVDTMVDKRRTSLSEDIDTILGRKL